MEENTWFKVRFFQDQNYEVYSVDRTTHEIVQGGYFIGPISDCEAWIRLTESERL